MQPADQWWWGASQDSWWQWHSGALGFASHHSEQKRSPLFASQVQTVCAHWAMGASGSDRGTGPSSHPRADGGGDARRDPAGADRIGCAV